MTRPVFGQNEPGVAYRRRPSVYGIALDGAGRVLVVAGPRGTHFLPGGGIEAGEDAVEALVREVDEETGAVADVDVEIGAADQLLVAADGIGYRKEARFFRVRVAADDVREGAWVAPAECRWGHECFVWAVDRARR
ncbi:MAG: NUDIX hydrolase [Planctomycetota bacterium]|nr:NUDIX hydrolase [Planctomycetota bacterium]